MELFWRALPKEKLRNQGLRMESTWFMWLRWRDASSSVCPPDRKVTPTSAGGTVLESALTVRTAYSRMLFSFLLACYDPNVTMFGFKRHPSSSTFSSANALNTAAKTNSVTFWETSAE